MQGGAIKRYFNREGVAGHVFVLPFTIGFLAFTSIPLLASLYLSFTRYDILSAPVFIGIENYVRMFTTDQTFWQSLGVTFFFTFVSVPLRLVFALFIAMLLVKPTKLTGLYRALCYLPSIMGGSVAVAVLWRRLFARDGLINALLATVGLDAQISWLGNPNTAIWTLILLSVWQFGSSMLIFVSGLKQIPVSYYEAAKVDGAGAVGRFFRITLPMLTPVIFFNLIMQMIGSFMSFTQCFIITGGKPMNTTLFYSVYMYQRSFEFYEMGYGCAMAWVMLVIISIFTFIVFKTSDKWVYYAGK